MIRLSEIGGIVKWRTTHETDRTARICTRIQQYAHDFGMTFANCETERCVVVIERPGYRYPNLKIRAICDQPLHLLNISGLD